MSRRLTDRALRPSRTFESEVALIITNNSETLLKIAGLTSILEYDLKPKPLLRIHDTYYDAKQGLLRNRKISLRIKRVHGKLLVSMKSNPRNCMEEESEGSNTKLHGLGNLLPRYENC